VFKEIWKGRLANKIKRETKGVGLFDFVWNTKTTPRKRF
jgi:hypothetical protein